ncbi:hypothetical protein H4582DRAFT_2028421 [Lactarius indigo]|nr:hypothetical protein H4582DRAFT_2028421 [Lactarius indigo]
MQAVGDSIFFSTISSSAARQSTRQTAPDGLPISSLFRRSAVTAILTNPIWVVKVQTFTAPPSSPAAYRGLLSALFCS